MSQMSTLTVADGAATPVNHTFSPETDSPPTWNDTDATKAFRHLQYSLVITRKKAVSSSGVNRIRVRLHCPIGGDGVSLPANEVSRFATADLELLLPAKGLKAERKDIRTLMRNILNDAQVIDIVDDLNAAW